MFATARTLLRRHVLAVIAIFIALGGTSFAVTGGVSSKRTKTYYACVTERSHTLNLTTKTAACPSGERKISFNSEGPRGARGRTGAPGATGATGPKGAEGPAGPKGADGAVGPAGPKGADGAVGPAGPKGDAGPQGSEGDAGPPGPQGLAGSTGPQGPAGARGAQGEPGPAGPQGERGPAGPQGATGATGPAGPAGPPGLAGVQTVSNDIQLTWPAGGTGSVQTGVACPAGKRVIGGGASASATAVYINASRPIDLPGIQRWSVSASTPSSNGTGQTRTFTVTAFVICATTAP